MNICNPAFQKQVFEPPKFYFIITTLFISFWLISLISAIKIVSFWGVTLTGGFLAFPFTTTLNCLIVEVYGFKYARQSIWSGTILCITYLVFINIVNIIPSSTDWELQKEFQTILIPQTRIIVASIVAFWFSGFINNYLMATLKCRGQSLAPRILFSSLVSIIIDLSLFFFIAFWYILPASVFYKIFTFAFAKKILCEIVLLPLIWYLIEIFKRLEGFEVDDVNTHFTPFSFDNVYDLNAYRQIRLSKSAPGISELNETNP